MSEKTNFDVLNGKLDKILALLSERSKDVITKEMGGEKPDVSTQEKKGESVKWSPSSDSKPPIVSEHVSGVNLEESVINFSTVYEGREYKGKWKLCKYKCGGLVSWPKDYKQGDKTLHVHPTDWEILGFSQKGLDGDMHCPLVRKK